MAETIPMSLVGDIAETIVRDAVTKAVRGFVAKGEITPQQAAPLVDGVMLEIQIALEIYANSQKPAPGA
jgi:polyhydroxyalkanoate synthesis regulator phasin